MKKVLFIAPSPPPYGGIASWMTRINERGVGSGWSHEQVDTSLTGRSELFGGKRSILAEVKRFFRILMQFRNRVKDVDVTHSAMPAGKLGLLREISLAHISSRKNIPYIIHYRCTLPQVIQSRAHLWLFKKLMDKVAYTIVLNEKSQAFCQQHGFDNVITLPLMLEANQEESIVIKKTIKKAIYVGGVIPAKGPNTIIEAARSYPQIEFELLGEIGPGVDVNSAPANVKFCGPQAKKDVFKKLSEADIFLFVGDFASEGFSNSLMEAMSIGLPCIVSDWASNPDMIEFNKGGVVIAPQSATQLVDAIGSLEAPAVREQMSRFNYGKVRSDYVYATITAQYVDLYNKLST